MPRLYHTKSKSGCARCRARRVKCDEIRPVCGGCSRHSVDCVYDRPHSKVTTQIPPAPPVAAPKSARASVPPPNATSTTAPVHAPGVTNPSPSSNSPLSAHPEVENSRSSSVSTAVSHAFTESRKRRYRELHLMHTFVTEVARSVPGTYLPEIHRIWSSDIPKLALHYEPLLNAIFACSLLYKISVGDVGDESPEELLTYRANYLEATLQDHRRLVGFLDPRTAEAVALTSVVLSVDAFGSLRERYIGDMGPYHPPTEWLSLCKGVRNVSRVTLDMVGKQGTTLLNKLAGSTASYIEPSLIYCEANRAKFPYLLERKDGDEESELDHEAYMDAVAYVGSILGSKESGELRMITCRRIMIFPIVAPTRFNELLKQHKPRALVILAHFFALAACFPEFWWIGDSGHREVVAINSFLDGEWKAHMAWPLEMIQEAASEAAKAAG